MRIESILLTLLLFFNAFLNAVALGGELRTETLTSRAIGREVKIHILLPDRYDTETERRFPTVYLLHGYGGDYTEWVRVGVVEEAAGLPVIIVMPEGDQSFYVNHHGDPEARWEDHITGEVVKFVDGKYRTIPRRHQRAVSGLSMGGYGAMMLGLRHPGLFASVASHSGALGVPGAVRAERIADRIKAIFGPEGSEEREAYDLVRLIRDLSPEKRPDIYLDCGSADFLLESNRAFVAELAKLRVPYEYREVPGAHNFAYWKRNVRYSLTHQLAALGRAGRAVQESVAGRWKVTSVAPDGAEYQSGLELTQEGEKISGEALLSNGAILKLSRGSFTGGKLKIEVDIERDDQKGLVRVEALLKDAGLAGRWSLHGEDGQEIFSGAWSAVAEKRREARKTEPPRANIAGDWDLVVTIQGNEIDYTLRIREEGGQHRAVLVSPRSGEHAVKKVESRGSDAFHMEIDREIQGTPMTWVYDGKLSGDRLTGKVVPRGFDQFSGTFEARRRVQKGAAETKKEKATSDL